MTHEEDDVDVDGCPGRTAIAIPHVFKFMYTFMRNKCLEPKDYQTQCIVYLGYVLMGEDE